LNALEIEARRAVSARFKRGYVSLQLQIKRVAGAAPVRVNRALFDQLMTIADELRGGSDIAPPRIDGLFAVPGVIEPAEQDQVESEARVQALRQGLEAALDALAEARLAEGGKIVPAIENLLGEIERLIGESRQCAEAQPEALKSRLREQVADLIDAAPALGEDRLLQEAALLAAKADVREELDRLAAHLSTARDLLGEKEAIGRRFDFLCQEFNREANTLCSKSTDEELTRIGLALKAAIEQLREQIQNIE
jgi:uncharacterized protein (TIGR00255 family)